MLTGDPERFALVCELDEASGGEWMFGRVSAWCAGVCLGNHELGASLRDVLFQLEEIATYAHRRENVDLDLLSATDLLTTLRTGLLDGREVAVREEWARHSLLPPVDVFDGWRVFVVSSTKRDRVVFARRPYDDVREVILRPGECDEVIAGTIEHLSREYRKASAPGVGTVL